MKRKAQVWIYRIQGGDLRILLFRLVPERGGFWQPVTGSVEAGESVEDGALRELREETGFNAPPDGLMDLQHHFRFQGRWGEAEEWAFAVKWASDASPVLDPREHTGFEWVDGAEALQRTPFPEQRLALGKLAKLLREEKKLS